MISRSIKSDELLIEWMISSLLVTDGFMLICCLHGENDKKIG